MKLTTALLTLTLVLVNSSIGALCASSASDVIEGREANTCGDPSTAVTYLQGYTPPTITHALSTYADFIGSSTQGGGWVIQNPVIRAWQTQQPGTVPMYRYFNAAASDFLYQLANNTIPGYALQAGQEIYVYATQVCGSVPMFAAFNAAKIDHYFSSDPGDAGRISRYGYADQGVVAYGLPVCGCE